MLIDNIHMHDYYKTFLNPDKRLPNRCATLMIDNRVVLINNPLIKLIKEKAIIRLPRCYTRLETSIILLVTQTTTAPGRAVGV